jgi:voltage-gated potassium channel
MLLVRLMNRAIERLTRLTWPTISSVFAGLYAFGALALGAVEPADSGLHSIANYSWWYLVTITTVGYGDLAPVTPLGRAAAGIIMIVGISAIGVILGKIGEVFFEVGRKRMRGLERLDERDHVVILGYNEGETEQVIDEIVAAADWKDRSIVVCSHDQDENPMPDRVKFVRGPLGSDDVMERACVAKAHAIMIHSNEDRITIVAALAASTFNSEAHMVVKLSDPESERHLLRINPRIECVLPLSVKMTVQALQDPGITRVMHALLSNVDDDVVFRVEVPASARTWRFDALLDAFKRRHQAILIGVSGTTDPTAKVSINPRGDFEVQTGMTMFYIASERLADLAWMASEG